MKKKKNQIFVLMCQIFIITLLVKRKYCNLYIRCRIVGTEYIHVPIAVKEMRKKLALSKIKFCEKYEIPSRTITVLLKFNVMVC
jgi:hypothetical protein